MRPAGAATAVVVAGTASGAAGRTEEPASAQEPRRPFGIGLALSDPGAIVERASAGEQLRFGRARVELTV